MWKTFKHERHAAVFNARNLVPLALLIFSLVVTYNLSMQARRISEIYMQDEFASRVRELNSLILQRMQVYEQVLRGALGLFAASGKVTHDSFREYVSALKLGENSPGIEGVGYAMLIPPEQKESHIRAMRKSGFPDYEIRPGGERELYTSIIYIEPFSGRNLRAFGFDMYSEERRRAAMAHARDINKAVISRKTKLIQESGIDVQAGFLMYLPVYLKGKPHDTVLERRKNLVGWVYAPFRMNDLMRGIEGVRAGDLDIEIYDGDEISDAALMFDSNWNVSAVRQISKFQQVEPLKVAEHQWQIAVAALPSFEEKNQNDRAALILRGGVGISFLLSLLVWVFLDDRARAIQAAYQAMQLALYDALTGLPNRKLITERLTHAIARAKRNHAHLALLFIDLDKFKPVNDEYGHAIGDLLLKDVARRLQGCMRESDTVARLGGDEFVALLTEVSEKHNAEIAATKVLHALTQPFNIAGHHIEIAASIGVAIYPEHGEDQNMLLKSADMAMYDAKNSGRSMVRFAPGLKQSKLP